MIKNVNNMKPTISIKLLLIFLCAIIPIYVLGLGIYNSGNMLLKKNISNSMSFQVEFYMNTLESEIGRIKSLEYECANDEDLLYLVNASQIMNTFEKDQAMLNVQKRLSVMKNSSIYIQDVSAYLPSIKKTISANSGITDLPLKWNTIESQFNKNTDNLIVYDQNDIYLQVEYPNMIEWKDRKPIIILNIKLSSKELKDKLLMFAKDKNSGALLINEKNQYLLASGSDKLVSKEILEKVNKYKSSPEEGSTVVKTSAGEYLTSYRNSKYLNLKLISYMPKNIVYAPIESYQILLIIFTFAIIIIIPFFIISTNKVIHKPLKKLLHSFRQLENGDLTIQIVHNHTDEFQYLYKSFNVMVKKLSELIEQVYKQKILAQRSELKQLQSQINPHFLYNSFFIMYRMAKDEDYDNIVIFSQHLAEYYRFITQNATEEVTLLSEVTHAKAYINIQSMRFYNRIDIKFGELPERYKQLYVPRLIIQPIIENVFEHGVKDNSGKWIINIEFLELKKGISIYIEDNGSGLDDSEISKLMGRLKVKTDNIECTGIINIHRRLQLKYGSQSGIDINRGELGGLKVEIRIIIQGEGIDV